MNCNRIKGLISSYIDGELNQALQKEIKQHLNTCDQCRQLEAELRRMVIEPLKKSEKLKIPHEAWDQVRAYIEKRRAKRRLPDLSSIFIFPLPIRRPAFALAAFAVILIIGILLTRLPFIRQIPVNTYLEEQAEYLIYLSGEAEEFYTDEIDFGTAIERYFL